MPEKVGGLPADAPARAAATKASYPNVADRPPARSEAVMNEQDRKKVEAELAAARDHIAKRSAEAAAKP